MFSDSNTPSEDYNLSTHRWHGHIAYNPSISIKRLYRELSSGFKITVVQALTAAGVMFLRSWTSHNILRDIMAWNAEHIVFEIDFFFYVVTLALSLTKRFSGVGRYRRVPDGKKHSWRVKSLNVDNRQTKGFYSSWNCGKHQRQRLGKCCRTSH